MPMTDIKVHNGKPMGFGAVLTEGGLRDATKVSLVLFENEYDQKPAQVIDFDPQKNRTGDVWHIYIEGLGAGTLYLYKVDGPYIPPKGLRFNSNKYLFDPYAKAFTPGSVFRSYNKQWKQGFEANFRIFLIFLSVLLLMMMALTGKATLQSTDLLNIL